MARPKTGNVPDLAVLLTPPTPLMRAVEQGILRRHAWSRASAPAAEQIAVRIAGLIVTDLIHAGHRLIESDISDTLHVSRAPVREALRILERERLVEFEPRRGAVVTAPDANDLADIYAVRNALYRLLFVQLMERSPDAVEAVFEARMPALTEAAERGATDAYALEGFLLNLALFDLARGRMIADMLASISLRTLRYVRLGLVDDPERMASSLRTWRALHRAVVRRDVDEVLKTAERRILSSRDAAL
ncbi:MAG: GntR family transcriptional regulator, partial [Burkholderiales bacterium]